VGSALSRHPLLVFVGKRLVAMAVLLVALSFVIFSLTYLAPGSAASLLLPIGERTPERIAEINAKYHLNDSYLEQYWRWARGVLHGNLGTSVSTSLPVWDTLKSRIPTTVFLSLFAYVLAMVSGVGSGIAAGMRRGSTIDRVTVGASIVALSAPAFVIGVFALYLFSVLLPVFPVAGSGTGFFDRLFHLTLPAITLACAVVAVLIRHTRAAVNGVVDQDFVTFARARGLSSREILRTYTLRNALIPIVTVSGPLLAGTVVAGVIVESTFSISGVGSLLVASVQTKDLPMIQGVALLFAIVIILMNLAADVAYFAIDPRIRLGRT